METVTGDAVIPNLSNGTWTVDCPAGKVLSGGVAVFGSAPGETTVRQNGPISATEWRAQVAFASIVPFSRVTMRITIICGTP